MINYGQQQGVQTLWEEEAVIWARKGSGWVFSFRVCHLKGANRTSRQREVRAQGWPGSASAGPGLGEQNDGKLSDSPEQQGPGPASISNTANTDSTKIYQLSFTLKDINGKLKLKTLEVSPSLF